MGFKPTALELCAGAGGQALGLERAGFDHAGVVEVDPDCCATLALNRPSWRVLNEDLNDVVDWLASEFAGVDLIAGGLPCPPFSVAGKQLGEADERNLFPAALRLVETVRPKAVMIENVRGFLSSGFAQIRESLRERLQAAGYEVDWRLLNASDFGVPQLRPRVVIVALRRDCAGSFEWPPSRKDRVTVGDALSDLMSANGWEGAVEWSAGAKSVAPTVVGGSKKHGGADLGPTRARRAWLALGVDGRGIANEPPAPGHVGPVRLTSRMVARVQGFPDDWAFSGKKTAAYRQVGNAFPPPVAEAVAGEIAKCLRVGKPSGSGGAI